MLIHVPADVRVLAMGVYKNIISTGRLEVGSTAPVVDRIGADDESVRCLIVGFEEPTRLWACSEAGPTGYELARVLRGAGMHCDVIAPSLVPARAGDRVKADKRDARRLALLFRGSQLSSVRVPTPAEEAVRDLCRARADMIIDRTRARQRLGKFLLGHGGVWRAGDNWTQRHLAWVRAQRFAQRALNETLAHYQATLTAPDAAVDAIEADLAPWCDRAPFCDAGGRLAGYRGITRLGALALVAEVCDWRRFPTAPMFMGFTGLVPSQFSSGDRSRRGGITHAGNTHLRTQLVEAAGAYKTKPHVGARHRRRQEGLAPEVIARAWAAQLRLCGTFRRLDARNTNPKIVVTAIARELAGFVWAEMTTT